MKILYIYIYGILGGVCAQIWNRLGFLSKAAEVDLLFFQDYGASKLFNKTNNLFFTCDRQQIEEIISAGKYDIISIIDTPQVFPAMNTIEPSTKLILEVHTTTNNIGYLSRLKKDEHILQKIQCIIVPSKYLQKKVADEFAFKGIKPIIVIPNSLATAHFYKRDITIRLDKKIILWVGKLDDHKNWKGFLEIAKRISRKRNDCVFWMVGGKTAPEEVVEELITHIDKKDLMESLQWIPYADYKYMPYIYSAVSLSNGCHLITSIDESFGMTMAEALSIGCPVIASNVGALPDVLDQFERGVLYEYGDYDEAARLVIQHVDDPTRLSKEFEEKSDTIKDLFSIDYVGKMYLDVLRTV